MNKKFLTMVLIFVAFLLISYLYLSSTPNVPTTSIFVKQVNYWLDLRTGQGHCGWNESKYDFAVTNRGQSQ